MIAVTAENKEKISKVNKCFSNSPWVLYFKIDDNGKIIINKREPTRDWRKGDKFAKRLLEHNINTVITGELGPGAFKKLDKEGVKIFKGNNLTAIKAVKKHQKGLLKRIISPREPGPRRK